MENQEIDVITYFYEREKSKAVYIRKESDAGLTKLMGIFA